MDAIQLEPVEIPTGNDYPINVYLEQPSQVAGERFRHVPDSGLGGVVGFFSLTKTEAATTIHATLSVALTEVTGTGYYTGTVAGAAITAQLAAYKDVDTPVYLVVADGTSLRCYVECRVVSSRRAKLA